MNEFIIAELMFFLSSLIWGAILFAAYDILRVLRNVFRHAKVIIAIEDIVFWVTAGILIFRMMYQMNDGIIRYYAVISIILGMKLYQWIFSAKIVKLLSAWFLAIRRLILRLIYILVAPIRYIIGKLKKFIIFIFRKVKKRAKVLSDCLKKRLKNYMEKVKIKKRERLKQQLKQHEEKVQPKQRGVLELIPVNKGDSDEAI